MVLHERHRFFRFLTIDEQIDEAVHLGEAAVAVEFFVPRLGDHPEDFLEFFRV
jgi:hypothetical protein